MTYDRRDPSRDDELDELLAPLRDLADRHGERRVAAWQAAVLGEHERWRPIIARRAKRRQALALAAAVTVGIGIGFGLGRSERGPSIDTRGSAQLEENRAEAATMHYLSVKARDE